MSQNAVNSASSNSETNEIPKVPYLLPFIGSGLKFAKDPDIFLDDCKQKYGDVFKVQLGGNEVTFLMNPLDFPSFFKHSKELNGGELTLEIAGATFGLDIPAIEKAGFKETHEEISRKKMFGKNLEQLTEKMQLMLEKFIFENYSKDWQEGTLRDLMSTTIFAAGGNAFFGEDTYTPELKKDFDIFDQNFYKLVRKTPTFFIPGAIKARNRVAEVVSKIHDDASELMVLRREGVPEDHPEMQKKLMDLSFFWASQSNTILVAYYTMQSILRDEKVKEIVLNEVRTAFDQFEEKTPFGSAKLDTKLIGEFKNLSSCIYEILRLTAAPVVMRQSYDDLDFELSNGKTLHINSGEYIAIYPRAMHLDEEVYENPHEFQWDRFLDKVGPNHFYYKGEALKHNLLPFGGGANMCPGRHFALNEFVITVAEMLYWFDFEMLDTHEPNLDISRSVGGIIPPKKDDSIKIKFKLRA